MIEVITPPGNEINQKKTLDRIIINFIPKRSITKYYHLSFLINLIATTIDIGIGISSNSNKICLYQ